jgi:hypothetical protein
LGNVHLQLNGDAFSPLQSSYDAKKILGAWVPTRPKHSLQAGRGDICFTGKFTKAYRCVDVVAQDGAACSKVAIIDTLLLGRGDSPTEDSLCPKVKQQVPCISAPLLFHGMPGQAG